jgi:hypothetical protein
MNRVDRFSRFAGAALLSGAAAVVFAQTAPSLDVKPGLWELTLTSSIDLGGAPPMDTSKMTPAQKAKMEETMKMLTQQHTDTQKKCITKEEMAKSFLEGNEESCTDKVTSNTAAVFDMTRTCTGERPSTTQASCARASASCSRRREIARGASSSRRSMPGVWRTWWTRGKYSTVRSCCQSCSPTCGTCSARRSSSVA